MGRLAVVTGSNKGVGYHVAQQLIASGLFQTTVLACRSPELGEQAARSLGGAGAGAEFMQLDISRPESVASFVDALKARHGRCDCLINNAAIAFKAADPTPFEEQTRPTLATNFEGTLALTEALLPLLRASKASPRLVNVASMAGKLSQLSPALQAKFSSPTLTLPQLRALVAQFEADVAAGRHRANGWSHSNYGMSKLALIAATRVLARELPGVRVNTCCPGYCDTDMSSHRGPRPPAEGARNAVLLATLPDDGPTGTFWRDYKAASW